LITDIMKKWLTEKEPKKPKEFKLYHDRIQKQINKNIEMALWLAKTRPDVFLNAVIGTMRMDEPHHKRFQDLLLIVQILKPELNIYAELKQRADEIVEEE